MSIRGVSKVSFSRKIWVRMKQMIPYLASLLFVAFFRLVRKTCCILLPIPLCNMPRLVISQLFLTKFMSVFAVISMLSSILQHFYSPKVFWRFFRGYRMVSWWFLGKQKCCRILERIEINMNVGMESFFFFLPRQSSSIVTYFLYFFWFWISKSNLIRSLDCSLKLIFIYFLWLLEFTGTLWLGDFTWWLHWWIVSS